MNTYLSSAQLKDKAKDKLTGHYGLLIGSSIVINLITFSVSSMITLFAPSGYTITGYILSTALSFLVSVFCGVFNVGVALMYLKFAIGNQASFSDIFYGFSHHIEKSLMISLVMNAIGFLPTLAYSVPFYAYMRTSNELYMYLMFPCLAVALVVNVLLALNLSQCYYLMLDFPDKSASEILSLSFRVMKGHKGRLFYIEISFLPLILLGYMSFIGVLWVIPYMQMTLTNFFFDIMKPTQEPNYYA